MLLVVSQVFLTDNPACKIRQFDESYRLGYDEIKRISRHRKMAIATEIENKAMELLSSLD